MACCIVGAFLFIAMSTVVESMRQLWIKVLGVNESHNSHPVDWSLNNNASNRGAAMPRIR
jgi:hypothetical protein